MFYFIVNEKSRTGKGADIWRDIERILIERGVSYQECKTEYEGHAQIIAEEICKKQEPDRCIVVVGGDGTANEVINGMSDFANVRFGLIPTGSGNDFAKGLGLPSDTRQCLERILDCKSDYQMDLGQVRWENCEKPRLFAISSGLGFDAEVCKQALDSNLKRFLNKLHLGKLTYIIITVYSLFSMQVSDAAGAFDKKGQRNFKKAIFFAAMNHPWEGGGVPMSPRAKSNDGKLSVCCVWGISRLRAFFCLPFLMAAKHEKLPGFEVVDCQNYSVHTVNPMVLHTDGEYCGDVTQVQFECLPAMLRVMK